MEKQLIASLNLALDFIENAYKELNYFVENEDKLNDREREKFYSYGRDKLRLNLVRLVGMKKSISAIMGDKRKEKDE